MLDVTAHENPTPWRELLPHAEGATALLLATGQFRASLLGNQRVGMFVLDSATQQEPPCVADVWISDQGLGKLVDALQARSRVRRGEWDVMYATPWNFAWTTDASEFSLWDRQGRLAWMQGASLVLRTGEKIAAGQVNHVEAYLSANWVERGVALVDHLGKRWIAAKEEDNISLADPTYDAFNIMCEAGWAVSLATTIAATLQVPMVKDDPL